MLIKKLTYKTNVDYQLLINACFFNDITYMIDDKVMCINDFFDVRTYEHGFDLREYIQHQYVLIVETLLSLRKRHEEKSDTVKKPIRLVIAYNTKKFKKSLCDIVDKGDMYNIEITFNSVSLLKSVKQYYEIWKHSTCAYQVTNLREIVEKVYGTFITEKSLYGIHVC